MLSPVARVVQATALAYGQREVVAASMEAVRGAPPPLRRVLAPLVVLYALRCLQGDLAWLLTEDLVPCPLAKALPGVRLCHLSMT